MTGDDIRAFREKWSLSQGELARRIGYHYSAVSLWESGKRAIPDRVALILAAIERTIPLGRLAEPRDVGHVVAFLASPLAGYVSGAVVAAHGGGEPPPFLAAADPDDRALRRAQEPPVETPRGPHEQDL